MPYYDLEEDEFAVANRRLCDDPDDEAALERHACAVARRYRSAWDVVDPQRLAGQLALPCPNLAADVVERAGVLVQRARIRDSEDVC